jgi:hypothetical protein
LPNCNKCRSDSNQRKIVRLFREIEVLKETLYGNGKPGHSIRLVQLESRIKDIDKLNMTVYGDGEEHVGLCVKVKDLFEYMVHRKAWLGYIVAIICSGTGAGMAAWVVAKMT